MNRTSRRTTAPKKVLVAGGAGFLGSHLCERLIAEGYRVICLDSFRTGSYENLRALAGESRFSVIEDPRKVSAPCRLLRLSLCRSRA